MKMCSKCGAVMADAATKCPQCGAAVKSSAPPAVATTQGRNGQPCDPRAIHNRYQPIGTRPGDQPLLLLAGKSA